MRKIQNRLERSYSRNRMSGSAELQKMPPDTVGGTVKKIKDTFPGAEITQVVSTAGGDILKIKRAPKRKKKMVLKNDIIDDEIPF